MIVGLKKHPAGECFRELDTAVRLLTKRVVCFNAHEAPEEVPDGAVVWHFENELFDYGDREVWTFSKRQAEATGWKYVPVGYHPSMERFFRSPELDIDVVHVGCMNARRAKILDELVRRDLRVVHIPPGVYGMARDRLLARARLCIAPMFHEGGAFCSLRAAHMAANHVPCLFEEAPEIWSEAPCATYDALVTAAVTFLSSLHRDGRHYSLSAHDWFKQRMPLELPS